MSVTKYRLYNHNFGEQVYLPGRRGGRGFERLINHVDPCLAARCKEIILNGNPVSTAHRPEVLVGVEKFVGEDCGFDEIPEWVDDLPALEILILDDNNINNIPDWFVDCVTRGTLVEISLQNCEITWIPQDLFSHQLRTVDLSQNRGEHFLFLYTTFFVDVSLQSSVKTVEHRYSAHTIMPPMRDFVVISQLPIKQLHKKLTLDKPPIANNNYVVSRPPYHYLPPNSAIFVLKPFNISNNFFDFLFT